MFPKTLPSSLFACAAHVKQAKEQYSREARACLIVRYDVDQRLIRLVDHKRSARRCSPHPFARVSRAVLNGSKCALIISIVHILTKAACTGNFPVDEIVLDELARQHKAF
jgi:hypothetical protein